MSSNSQSSTLMQHSEEDLVTHHENITKSIALYQEQERDVFDTITNKQDPNRAVVEKQRNIERKLDDLRAERDREMRLLTSDYHRQSAAETTANQIKLSAEYLQNLQKQAETQTKESLTKTTSDIYTLRRLVMHDQKRFSDKVKRNAFLKYILSFFCISIFLLGSANMHLLSVQTVLFIWSFCFVFTISVLSMSVYQQSKDNNILVNEKNFANLPDSSSVEEEPTTKCITTSTDAENIIDSSENTNIVKRKRNIGLDLNHIPHWLKENATSHPSSQLNLFSS